MHLFRDSCQYHARRSISIPGSARGAAGGLGGAHLCDKKGQEEEVRAGAVKVAANVHFMTNIQARLAPECVGGSGVPSRALDTLLG